MRSLWFLLSIINSDVIEQTVIGADGKRKRVGVAIPLDMRLDAAKAVAPYLHPRLNAQTISGPNDAPIAVAGLDITKILRDPALANMAQRLALAMVESNRTPGPPTVYLPGDR